MKQLLIYNANLVDKDHDIHGGAVLIAGTRIKTFPSSEAIQHVLKDKNVQAVDAQGCTLMPSFIDMHAHFRDPGQTQKEDISSGMNAAVAGGFGTCVLMPNTAPVVSSAEMAKKNNCRAEQAGLCQILQSVSITKNFDGKTFSHLESLSAKTVPLITEDGHEVADSAVMLQAMKLAAKKKLIVSCHCEDPMLAAAARPLRTEALNLLQKNNGVPSAEQKRAALALLRQADDLLALAEDVATERNVRLAEEAGCHIHLCHVSTARCIDLVRRAQKRGVSVTCEITPHHLSLATNHAYNRIHLVNPPLRSEADRMALIAALQDGTASAIATDHAPHTSADKAAGAPGFSGLETAFAACYTTLCLQNGMSLSRLSELFSANPAKLLKLKNRGLLANGFEADLVLVDTKKSWIVHGSNFASKGTYTPFEGKKLHGKILATFYKGRLVFEAP